MMMPFVVNEFEALPWPLSGIELMMPGFLAENVIRIDGHKVTAKRPVKSQFELPHGIRR
jgi:hypothetical protein